MLKSIIAWFKREKSIVHQFQVHIDPKAVEQAVLAALDGALQDAEKRVKALVDEAIAKIKADLSNPPMGH